MKCELLYLDIDGDLITSDEYDDIFELIDAAKGIIEDFETYGNNKVASLVSISEVGDECELWTNDDLIKGVDYEL